MVRLHFFRVLIYLKRHFADLYTLPPNRLTHALADAVAMNFYARVPPDLRPSNLRDKFPDLDADDAQPRNKEIKSGKELNEKDVIAEKEEVARALDENATPAMAASALPTASTTVSAVTTNDGDAKQMERKDTAKDTDKKKKKSKYPSRPLLAALHATFFWRWWIAGAMKLCAGEKSLNYKIVL